MPPRFTLRSSLTAVPTQFPAGRRFGDRIGDNALTVVTGLAGIGVVVLIGAIAWKVFDGSSLSFSEFGLGFLVHSVWDPVHNDIRRAVVHLRDGGRRPSSPCCSPRRSRSESRCT